MKNLLKAIILILDEAILVAIALVLLWKFGINLSPLLIAFVAFLMGLMVLVVYRSIRSATRGEPMGGKKSMIGLTGIAVTCLDPEGMVRAHGELWKAECTGDAVKPNEEIEVLGVVGLKLIVKRKDVGEQS